MRMSILPSALSVGKLDPFGRGVALGHRECGARFPPLPIQALAQFLGALMDLFHFASIFFAFQGFFTAGFGFLLRREVIPRSDMVGNISGSAGKIAARHRLVERSFIVTASACSRAVPSWPSSFASSVAVLSGPILRDTLGQFLITLLINR